MAEETVKLVTALVECQKQFKNLGVNKKGYNYEYLTLDKLIDETRDILAQNGLVVVQTMRVTEGGKNLLKTALMHVSGGVIEGEYVLEPVDVGKSNAAQKMGASITYARRYTLAALLGIAQADSDGVNPNSKPEPPAKKPPVKKSAPTKTMSELQTRLSNAIKAGNIDGRQWCEDQGISSFFNINDEECLGYVERINGGEFNA